MKIILSLFLAAACVAHAAVPADKIQNVRTLLRDHKLAAAEAAANSLVAANPTDAVAQALLGSVAIAKDDAEAAVAAYEQAAELAPADGDLQRQLGDAYGFAAQKAGMLSKMGFAKKCRVAYEKAVELDPKNLNARSSLMGFYQQAPGLMGGGMDKAYAQAAAIRRLDATRGRLAYATLYSGEKKYAEAFAEFDEVLKASPDDYAALYQVGKLAALSGQSLDRGLASLRRCLELTPPDAANTPGHAAAQWRIGNILEKKSDPAGARAAYGAALKLDPKFTAAADALKKLP
ncbi:MAG: Tetratricopeptide repeat protein [Lacunisphaera sp.]|nr:Tetratricopeptide repeat protein [Lacunisphaera sp.]MDB6165592.1 Tetratricopeptide repeat protein [Lacunisphaera sp.]